MFCIAMAQRFVLWIQIMELHHRKGLLDCFLNAFWIFLCTPGFPYGQLCSDLCIH